MHSGTPLYTLFIRRSAPRCSVIATFPHKGRLNRAVNRCASVYGYAATTDVADDRWSPLQSKKMTDGCSAVILPKPSPLEKVDCRGV